MNSNILGSAVDKSQIPPLHQKRILAFVNHFVINSCSFLNDFASKCETKFIEVERKIQKVESSLIIIEAKLSSIPGLPVEQKSNPIEVPSNEVTNQPRTQPQEAHQHETEDKTADSADVVAEEQVPLETGVKACEDARYIKFFKMLQFGVPANAVKLKMQSEGVDPTVLDTPNRILPDGIPR